MDNKQLISSGKRTLEIESKALQGITIDEKFATACQAMLKCEGRIIIIGIGKSGHIARKIAATFTSTGTPAFFVHSAEAGHGDMGMITKQDLVIMVSYSGKSDELVNLIPPIKRLNIVMLAITGEEQSPLAQAADIVLSTKVSEEACPLGLAPTSSTTATLVLGDCLAIALLEARGFTADDFAFSHPSGTLGRKLLLKVDDIMHKDKDIPKVSSADKIDQVLIEMTSKRLGMTTIVDKDNKLVGVFTDGDLRRCLDKKIDINTTEISEVMSTSFSSVQNNELAVAALKLMEEQKINSLPVLDDKRKLIGALNMHDLLRAGVL